MENNNAQLEKEIIDIRQNQQDEYWTKKYGVSPEDLKKTKKNVGISAKIIEAAFKKTSLSV